MTAALRLLPVVLFLAGVVPAWGQAAPQVPVSRGAGGIFGNDDGRPARHKVDLTLSAVGANDSDTPENLVGAVPTDAQIGGMSTMLLGGADYRYEGRRVQAGVTATSSFRHYAELSEAQTTAYSVGAGVSAELDPRTSVFVNQSVAYSPSYLYGLFPGLADQEPGDATPIAPDYVTDDSESYVYGSSLSLTRGLSRRSSLTVRGEYTYTDFVTETALRTDLNAAGVSGTYSRNVSKNVALSVGYRYRRGKFGLGLAGIGPAVGATSDEHGIDFGLHYVKPLSPTRELSFDASLGPSTVSLPTVGDGVSGDDRLVRGSGAIGLGYQFIQNWRVRAAYSRALEYVATLGQPVYADGISVDLTGLPASRLEISASGRYSSGASVLNAQNQLLDTTSAQARMQVALSRSVAAYGEYIYYYYSFNRPVLGAPGLPGRLERTGVRVGLSFWVPAFRR